MIRLFLLLVLLANFAYAEGEDADLLSDLLPAGCFHSGSYSQIKSFASLPDPVKSSGSFLFSCELGLIWQSDYPINETLIYKKRAPHYRLSELGESTVLDQRIHKELAKLLNKLVGGDVGYLIRKFSLTEDGDGVKLVPRSARMRSFLQSVELRRDAEKAISITLRHKDQEATAMRIYDTQESESFAGLRCHEHLNHSASACNIIQQ
jgi:hypothetical protein